MTDKYRSRQLAALREGRVRIRHVTWPDGLARAQAVTATVIGWTGHHQVHLEHGLWHCTCPDGPACPHTAAVGLVTGWPDAGRPQLTLVHDSRSTA